MMRRRTFLMAGGAAAAAASMGLPAASAAAQRPFGIPLGVAWYPEAWPESRWPTDLALMRAADIGLVRIAEFSWSTLEPSEGRFEFGWLDRAIDLAAEAGMQVVIGTPTAAPPAWMTHAYPETLLIEENGTRATHGGRRHFSFTNPRYRAFAAGIAERMARRYGRHPAVVGWQIDNEVGKLDFGPETERLFRAWLRRRFGDLDRLNAAWSGSYWSQAYSDWDQLIIPRTMNGPKHNPGLVLAWRIFVNETWADYIKNQYDALRAHAEPRQFITSNMTGEWDNVDQLVVSGPVDLVSWGWYFQGEHLKPPEGSLLHNLARGLKQKNVWVLEAAAGNINWTRFNFSTAPGEARAMAWQAVAHGADAYCFWNWRNALGGQEQMHGAVVGADGQPGPFYAEVAAIGRDFRIAGPAFENSTPVAQAAMLHDYRSRWSINGHRHHDGFDPWAQLIAWHAAIGPRVDALDVVAPTVDLGRYKLVFAPSLHVLDPEVEAALVRFVEAGGHLVLGPRSGIKDPDNALWPARGPGPLLSRRLGAGVAQAYALNGPVQVSGALGAGTATIWGERIEPALPDVEVLAAFGEGQGWLTGRPAVVSRRVEAGRITYVGGWLDAPLMDAVAARAFADAGVAPIPPLPAGVERRRRVGPAGPIDVVINWNQTPVEVEVPPGTRDLLSDRAGGRATTLAPYDVMVLTPRA